MKNKRFKIVFIVLAIILCVALTSVLLIVIKNNYTPNDISGTGPIEVPNTPTFTTGVLKGTEYTAKFHSIRYYQSIEAVSPTLITNRAELENYELIKEKDPIIAKEYLDYMGVPENQYLDTYFSHCTEDFFENKNLILFLSGTGSSSVSHAIEGLEIDEKGNLVITYNKNIPESANDDIVQRLIVIEIDKSVGITGATPILINEIITTPIFSDAYSVEFYKQPPSDADYTYMYTLIRTYDELGRYAWLKDKYSPDFFKEKSLMILNLNGCIENQPKDVQLSVTNKDDLIFNIYSDSEDIKGTSSCWVIVIEIDRQEADAVRSYNIDIIYN